MTQPPPNPPQYGPPPGTPQPYGQQPPPPGYPQQPYGQPPYYPQPHQTVTTSGLPGWMHAVYAVATVFTCGLAGIAWGIHWWFAKSKSRTTTHY